MDEGFIPVQQDALVNLGNMWMERSATLIGTMTNRSVSITNGQFKETKKEELEREFPGQRFLAEVNIDGFNPIYLLLTAEDAAIIVDLVIGGDGKGVAVEFSDLHLSVLEEAVNEISSALADIYSTFFNAPQKVLPTKGQVDGLESLNTKSLVQLKFDFVIEGLLNSYIHTLIESDAAHVLAEKLFNLSPQVKSAPSSPPSPPVRPVSAPAPAPAPAAPPVSYTKPVEIAVASSPPIHVEVPVSTAVSDREVSARPVQLPELTSRTPVARVGNLDLIMDVSLQLTAVLGRTGILIKDLITLGPGSVLELDKLAGEPVELMVNNKLVARGEVVVVDEKFGVRITDIVSQVERIQGLKG